jgi:uncharacterized repeat protein (TIGR01451 family)
MLTLFAGASLAVPTTSSAGGTPACTEITNRAIVAYEAGGTTHVQDSNVVTTVVAEVLDVNVVWQDATDVAAAPGEVSRPLTFLVTNTGNGLDTYTLTGLSALPGDDFDPVLGDVYLDANGDGLFSSDEDERYVAGSNDPTLEPDQGRVVFVLNDMPMGLDQGDLGRSSLTATSNTGAGDPGSVMPGAGDCGSNAVVGTSGGADGDVGTYVIRAVYASIVKTASVADPFGGTEPTPGARITYSLIVTVSGSGVANGLVITDPIPSNTVYDAGTLTLDGVSLTDELDADQGDVGGTTPAAVTIDLGDVPGGSPPHAVGFDVVIE